MPFPLETERLIIRPFRDADVDSFLAYRNDPEVAKYQGWTFPYPREKAVEFIAQIKIVSPVAIGVNYQAAIENKETGELIGDLFYLIGQGDSPQARIGYTLSRAHWKKGYASEAAARLLDFFFHELAVHRVVADCDTENTASVHLLERLGFRREAHFIESFWMGNYWGDEYYYGMLEREWRK